MRKITIGAALLAGVFLNSACATLTRGTTEAFEVRTIPSGASVTTTLGKGCTPTPCAIPKVSREAEFSVTLEKDGYKTSTYRIGHESAGGGAAGMAGNAILGVGIGAVVDANTGATRKLVPNPLTVELEKIPDPNFPDDRSIETIADEIFDHDATR
ncbi:MAG: translation initiation factor 2 [Pseudomonadota bacterium]